MNVIGYFKKFSRSIYFGLFLFVVRTRERNDKIIPRFSKRVIANNFGGGHGKQKYTRTDRVVSTDIFSNIKWGVKSNLGNFK